MPVSRADSGYVVTAFSALTRPAPQKLLLPAQPWQTCPVTQRGATPAPSSAGHGIFVAVARRSAPTDPAGISGFCDRISATTPAACGAAIDVPFSHAQ